MVHTNQLAEPVQSALDSWSNPAIAFYPIDDADPRDEHREPVGTNFYLLQDGLFTLHVDAQRDLTKLRRSFHASTAVGRSLDSHGGIVGLNRKQGESDGKYRKRIITKKRASITGTTTDEIISFAAYLTDTDPTAVRLYHDWASYDHTALIDLPQGELDNATLSKSEIADSLKKVAPSGGDIVITVDGSFELKATGDVDDATKGLTGATTSEGGTLSGFIAESDAESPDPNAGSGGGDGDGYGTDYGTDWGH